MTMITPSYLGETIEYSSLHACRSTLEDPTISQSSSQNDICLVVESSGAERTVEALRLQFAKDLAHEKVEHITLDPSVAIVTVVGKNMRGAGTVGRTFAALGRENVDIVAIAQGSSECNVSFVAKQQDVGVALAAIHQEFQLGSLPTPAIPVKRAEVHPSSWQFEVGQRTASAD